MRFPALTRMLGVFLAVVSLLTVAAGWLGLGSADRDYQEQNRQDELLDNLIFQTETLQQELAEKQFDYDAVMRIYPGRKEQHRLDSAAYRMDLATYTATRGGLEMGRKQLDETAAMLDESMATLMQGFLLFLDAEEEFLKIYDLYASVRAALDQALSLYASAAARMPEGTEPGEVEFSPDEILALAELEHSLYAQIRDLLTGWQENMPSDQRQTADYIRKAIAEYNEAGGSLESFDVERLAYDFSKALYTQAQGAMDGALASGLSYEEARAAADRICSEVFGLSFDEVSQWLDGNMPTGSASAGGSVDLSPEMLEMLLSRLPNDRDLVDIALGLLDDSENDLRAKEDAFRADPHDMSAAELLLAAAGQGLDALQRLFGLIEPTIVEAKKTMDATHGQLDFAWATIHKGQLAVQDSYKEMLEKDYEQFVKFRQMKRTRRELAEARDKLDELAAVVDDYEALNEHYRSLRGQLLADDEIFARKEKGEDVIEAAYAELNLRRPAHSSEFRWRRWMCALMIAGGLFGFIASLGCFEKPKMRRLWIPLLLAALPAAGSEAIALGLGRGLLYSALFVLLFALVILPLILVKPKGDLS